MELLARCSLPWLMFVRMLDQERHASELRDFQQRLLAKPTGTKYSREYLNLRKIQETLAKAKECVATPPRTCHVARSFDVLLLLCTPYTRPKTYSNMFLLFPVPLGCGLRSPLRVVIKRC